LFATGDSITEARLASVVEQGYEEDKTLDAKVVECLHISQLMERASEFDLIHNHFDFLPLTYSRLIKTPLLTTIHGFSSEKILAVYQKYNASSGYISISNADRHPSLDYLGTVYNGLNTADFSFKEVPKDYLLFFGRIHPDKGAAEAIQIALKAKRRLVIAGIVQDAGYFERSVAPYLNDDITYVGSAGPEKRNELLGNAYALLHPIRFEEPFGLSVAEAMLCGTPVIAFNKGSMPELIKDKETGFLVDTVDEAVAAVSQIAAIDRATCRAWSAQKFSKEKMAEDYLALYHRILS
jgi:glycosyltransferase involved in cell wall biosynthesis